MAAMAFVVSVLILITLLLLLVKYVFSDSNTAVIGKAFLLGGIPLSSFLLIGLYRLFFEVFVPKPDMAALAGVYRISRITSSQPDSPKKALCSLRLYSTGRFSLSARIPGVNLCDSGSYFIDYAHKNRELCFKCGQQISFAHIERRKDHFSLLFMIGDPDDYEGIYFEKPKNQNHR